MCAITSLVSASPFHSSPHTARFRLTIVARDWLPAWTDGSLHLSGIDEGWEGCGQGITVNGRKTQHYANGTPAINEKFPDMAVSAPCF